jgi:hypothetical protein
MNRTLLFSLIAYGLAVLVPSGAFAQGGNSNERTAIMNGNQVQTVFGNWGVIGQPANLGHRGAWKNPNDGYLGDVSPLVGAEVKWNDPTTHSLVTFHSVVTCPVNRPTALRDQNQSTGKYWTWEPLPGYFNPNVSSVALSNNSSTWPPFWPDKLGDLTDPGWRGSWNGYFGKKSSADLETYFVMDDNNDEHFNVRTNNSLGLNGIAFKPDSTNPARNGMALQMSVRALQWSQFLAKDNIFWLYEISNQGTTTYDRAVFGMLVGTYVGVTSVEDYGEYANDWSFYDVNNNITYTGQYGGGMLDPFWVGSVGMVGYAFLESPGNPFDGIDNDGDADSSAFANAALKFTSTDFDSVTIMPNQQIVLINDDYSRYLFTVPNVDSVQVYTRGWTTWIKPGKTRVAEGNVLRQLVAGIGTDVMNPNAYDGVDNNFNGLIDENFYVHYHQLKKEQDGTVLIDILRPVEYVHYKTGAGSSPLSMIDEKRDDLIDNNQNWNFLFDDVGRDGIPNTGDYGEGDGIATSGYDANYHDTGLPGEPHIDKTDVKESDQIGLTNFYYFTPASTISLGNDELLWTDLEPGFFDVPKSIVNNRPIAGEDGDFVYGSGYFPLLSKTTERFSLALVYGGGRGGGVDADIADLLKNKKTVQKIYDANYQFPQPPNRPTLTAVAGDHQVTLYWDRAAELTVDPVLQTKTFEGYKIYKSTDPTFADIFVITDGTGDAKGYTPLAQFDLVDGISGIFQATGELLQDIYGYGYNLGSDNGLQHSYVDNNVDNGQRYFYALVAYNRGDQSLGILPAENDFPISIAQSGVITHPANVAVVTPNPKTAGYVSPKNLVQTTTITSKGTGSVSYQVIDATAITAHRYRVEFLDTQVDSIDNNGNGLIDLADSTEWDRRTSFYFVRDLETVNETFTSEDTLVVRLKHGNLIPSTVQVSTQGGTVIDPSTYRLDTGRGAIRAASPGSMTTNAKYVISYQYYPVYKSAYLQGSPFVTDTKDADNFDGVQMVFGNDWSVVVDTTRGPIGWSGKNYLTWSISPLGVSDPLPPYGPINGYKKPADYRIEFSNTIVDTSLEDDRLGTFATPLNFRVYNETDSTYIKFLYVDNDFNGYLSPQDEIVFVEKDPRGQLHYTWDVNFPRFASKDSVSRPGAGDRLLINLEKPFEKGDVFEFTTAKPTVNQQTAAQAVNRVRAVPNPYVTASSFEPPLAPGITSGRGTRKIEFIHVPANATIRIFTARGDHVVTLRQDGNIEDGMVSWNLKTSENLDVAYGVYFYIVESTVGTTTGKLAIIK